MTAVHNNHLQKGYGGIEWVLLGGVVAFSLYFFLYPTLFKKPHPTAQKVADCVLPAPDGSNTITLDGVTYGLIKENASIIKREHDIHLMGVGKATDPVDGKQRDVAKPTEDIIPGGVPTLRAAEWPKDDPEVLDLRFMDITDRIPLPQDGINHYSVYLKMGDTIPEFIKVYCALQISYPSLFILQDVNKGSFPPLSFKTNDITNVHNGITCDNPPEWYTRAGGCRLPNTTYYLFAYEPKNHRDLFGDSTLCYPNDCGTYLHGDLPITIDATTQTIRIEYFPNAVQLMMAFSLDPSSPYYNYQFDYAPEEFIKAADLNTNFGPNWNDKTLQLRAFVPFTLPAWGWWTPECKPAVYLYPQKDTVVNIKVNINNGFLTYTDPLYPKDSGWNVLAHPNGDLNYLSNNLQSSKGVVNYPTGIFPYLYYEGKVKDESIQKPQQGFVEKYTNLSTFFDELLPRLGLNAKETEEFKAYWLKALPKSNYYFIGIVPQANLDTSEPLTITPKQDTMIRVRLYFQQLDQPTTVQQPQITTPQRNGFTVVDWGAYVKNDQQHPFTCVQ